MYDIRSFNSAYDAAGNVLNDNLYQYLYDGVPVDWSSSTGRDAEGRLCAVQDLTGDGATGYVYDAEGRRVAEGSLSSWACAPPTSQSFTLGTSFVLGLNGEQVSEIDISGTSNAWQHTNVFAAGRLLATYNGNNTYIALNDWVGTKRAEVAASGCYQTYYSNPFGDNFNTPSATCADDATEQHFTGKERDTESGNDYFDARYYSSAMGRFMSPDWSAKEEPVPYAKLDNPQSLNLYSYVLNNPITAFDNDGHEIIFAANATQVMRDSVQAILADPNTRSNLSGYVGPNNPNLTIQSGDLSSMDSSTLTPDGAPGGSITQGVTAPDIVTTSGSSTDSNGVTTQDPTVTTLQSTTLTIDSRTSAGDVPGVMVHETVHAGEARANPAQYNKDAKAEHANPCHNCRPQKQRANAAQKQYGPEIKKAVKQIEKDRKKENQ
jgi:RHS repeat-associated protein